MYNRNFSKISLACAVIFSSSLGYGNLGNLLHKVKFGFSSQAVPVAGKPHLVPVSHFSWDQLYRIPYACAGISRADQYARCTPVKIPHEIVESNVLVVHGKPVGFCQYECNLQKRSGYLAYLGVHPAHQGKGYGSFLLEHMVRFMDQRNIEKTSLFVSGGAKNIGAMHIYKKYGFVRQVLPYEQDDDAMPYMVRKRPSPS